MRFEPYSKIGNLAYSTATQAMWVLLDDGTQKEVKDQINWDTVLGYAIVDKPNESQLAPGHNPKGLFGNQIGVGFRLLDEDEIKDRDDESYFLEVLIGDSWVKGCTGSISTNTYRTRLSREQLRLLDEGWTPWLGEGEPPTGRVECIRRHKSPVIGEASNFRWTNEGYYGDIIAYRPAKKEKKIVPFTRETIPNVPFMVIAKSSENKHAVTVAGMYEIRIAGYAHAFSYNAFKEQFIFPDGSPCGREVYE